MTTEERNELEKAYRYYLTWENSSDGSDGACWEGEVVPKVKRLLKKYGADVISEIKQITDWDCTKYFEKGYYL